MYNQRERERERESERARDRERERYAYTFLLFAEAPTTTQCGRPMRQGNDTPRRNNIERECNQLRALQKDPHNIEFARSVRETRRNKSTRMSSSSEHNIIDYLLAFEAKAAQKTPLDRWRACNDRRSAHFEEQHGKDTPRRNIPRLRACAKMRSAAQNMPTRADRPPNGQSLN